MNIITQSWLVVAIVVTVAATMTANAIATTATKPNIVLMIVDELGTGDVPWEDTSIHAPTINQLGREGLRLGTMYAWQWCAPTRGSLLSGRFPMHTGYIGGGMPGNGEGMDLRVPLLPQALKRVGYSTHMLGKWHLGFRTVDNIPISRGFDSFFGLLAGGADHFTKTLEACGGDGEECKCGNLTSNKLPFRVDFFDQDKPAKDLWDTTTYDAYQYAERAVQIVKQHNTSNPFFLYWAPHKVHSPLQSAPEFLQYYTDASGKCSSTPETCAGRGYGTSGAGCGCSLMCYCNRRMIRAMVSTVDAMVYNFTIALQEKDMWSNTIFILLGDNGAPNNNAGWNTVFKGMKFSHWEGGHRVPSFFGGPALPSMVAQKWYNGTVHLVDLHATVLDFAGATASNPSGVKPVDGVSIRGVMNGSLSLQDQVRTELWIADDILRVGEWKLITGKGAGSSTCMIGIGGLPVAVADDPNNLSTTCGTHSCKGTETGPDAEICAGCKCPTYNLSDATCKPCLFNVVEDPGEFTNLASQNTTKVEEMMARVRELALGTVTPDYPPDDMYASCKAMVDAGGFFVPWASPPPPPIPITPDVLRGIYKMDEKFTINVTVGQPIAPNPNAPFDVSFDGCGGCCWTKATGTATPEPGQGAVLSVVGRGASCTTGDRICTGIASGSSSSVTIDWTCTCSGISCGAFGKTPWVKQDQ